MKLSKDDKEGLFFVVLILTLAIAGFLCSCSPQHISANDKSQEEMIFELKCKLENQQELVRAYQNVLHEVWLDKPAYVEDALSEGDAFIELEEIMGDTDVFKFHNKRDSIRYMYNWYGEELDYDKR